MFVKDTFTDVAETALTSHTGEIGATWTRHASSPASTVPKISNANRLKGQAAFPTEVVMYASGTAASADHAVQADFVAISNSQDDANICGRVDTASLTFYMARISYEFGGGVQLYKCVAGVFTQLGGTYTYALAPGSQVQIRLEMFGSFINVYLNGSLVINQVDASIASGTRVGVRMAKVDTNTTGFHLDNIMGLNQLYWVGGDGDINSAAHWSRTSGGSGGVAPLTTHDAIVDQSSGSPTITVNANQQFASLTMGLITQYTDTTKTITLTGSGSNALTLTGDLAVYGNAGFGAALSNVNITDKSVWRQFSASYIPKLTLTSVANVTCDHTPLGVIRCNVTTLIHTTGTLTLPLLDSGDAYASLNVGTFDTTTSVGSRTVVFGNSVMGSEMYVSTKLDLGGTGVLTLSNLNRLVVYFDGSTTTAALASKTVASIHVNSGSCAMTGDNAANSLILERGITLSMSGSCTFGYVAVASRMQIVIAAGKVLTGRLITQNYNDDATDLTITSGTDGVTATWNMSNGGALVKTRWRVQDIVFTNGSIIAYHSIDLGNNAGISFIRGFTKYYRYAVYNFAGVYISDLPDDVVSDPSFLMQINAPPGQLIVRRQVDPSNFGEGTLIDYDNKIIITCFSDLHPNGIVIYKGAIETYQPNDEVGNEYVEIVLMPYAADLAQFPLTDTSSIDVSILQDQPITQLSFTSSKLAVSWTTGVGVTSLWSISTAAVLYANSTSLTVSIYKDNGTNTPDNTVAVYQTTYDVTSSAVPQTVPIPAFNIAVSASSKYWLVVDTHGGNVDASRVSTSNNYVSGNAAYWNGASWVQSAGYGIDSFYVYVATADTSVSFAAQDLLSSLQTVMTTYRQRGGTVGYNSSTLEDPGITFTYDFISNTMLDAIQKFVDQCPAGWYWYIDPATNLLHLHPPATTPTHRFAIGVDVEKVKLQKTKATIVNNLYIQGGDTGGGVNLFRNYINSQSIARYRLRTKFYNDVNLIDATAADSIGEKIIGQSKDPISRAPITVLGTPDVGADIEVIRPGDVFVVLGKDATPEYMQVGGFDYSPSRMDIDASTAPTQINATLNDTQVALRQQQSINNPSSATVVEVL